MFDTSGFYYSLFSVDRGVRYVACAQESTVTPKQIVLVDLLSGNVRNLVDLNPELRNIRLSVPVRMVWEAGRKVSQGPNGSKPLRNSMLTAFTFRS